VSISVFLISFLRKDIFFIHYNVNPFIVNKILIIYIKMTNLQKLFTKDKKNFYSNYMCFDFSIALRLYKCKATWFNLMVRDLSNMHEVLGSIIYYVVNHIYIYKCKIFPSSIIINSIVPKK
jgi:hypothetical protein